MKEKDCYSIVVFLPITDGYEELTKGRPAAAACRILQARNNGMGQPMQTWAGWLATYVANTDEVSVD
ncbi:MAG: hypothetical protein ACFFCF_09510 [Promethearchaeota archaeon]